MILGKSKSSTSYYVNFLILCATIGCIAILIAAYIFLQQSISKERSDAFKNAMEYNKITALSDEVRIRSLLASLDKVILVVRKDFAINKKLNRSDLIKILNYLKIDSEMNPRISFTNSNGNVLISSAVSSEDKKLKINLSDREYFKKAKISKDDFLDVAVPVKSRFNGKWVIPLTRKITNKDGSFAGIVSMAIDPILLTNPFEKTSSGINSTRSIIGVDGYTRVRLTEGKIAFGGDIRKSQLFEEIKKSKNGSYISVAVLDGVKRSISYREIDPYGIVILAGSSVESIENSFNRKINLYIFFASVFSSLITLLTIFYLIGSLRQKKLLESKQNFNKLIELVPQLVSGLDAEGNIVWVNSRAIKYVGPNSEELVNGFDWILSAIHPEDRSRVNYFLNSSLTQNQNMESCEYRKRRFDGEYLWFSSQITRVSDKVNADISFLQTGTDIHDRKMTEERYRVAQKLESIGQLTGGMAHDFNNLLAIILGNLELAKPNITPAEASEQVESAIIAAERGVGLVKSLLALASKQPLLPSNIDIYNLIKRIEPILKNALGQRIEFKLNKSLENIYIKVDEAGLEAVLLNLIVNARDAMPDGGNLTINLTQTDGVACISISDTGYGMTPIVLKRAIEPFFTTKERGHGTGLGLSMVAGFVKQSGGTMGIKSSPSEGTAIEILLPVAPYSNQQAQATSPSTHSHKTDSKTILIVDDEKALAKLIQTWAKSEGHTAVVTNSSDDALTLLKVRFFDILLTDIMMPGQMNGITLAEKASIIHPEMSIILMSGYSKETATRQSDIQWPLIVKPFRRKDFYEAISG